MTEQRYRELLDGVDAIIWEAEAETLRLCFVSQGAERLLGYPLERWLNEPNFFAKLLHPDDREATLGRLQVAAREMCDQRLEFRVVAADGRIVWLSDHVRVVTDSLGRARRLRGAMIDITNQKHALDALRRREQQLRQAQKLEALGRLAGGIAHDFNNLLTAIQGHTSLMLAELEEGDAHRADLQEIKRAAERAASLTRQLLAFSRKQVLQPKIVDLNVIVQEMEKLLRRVIGEDIELVVLQEPSLGRALADPGQLEQVVMNLVVNARDAMPCGGRITIETANVDLDERTAQRLPGPIRPGPYVMLAVTDTGHGMDKETQSRIFEPFFTTKEKGTGLGLSTVYGIVKQSGGYIWVYSEPGQGTTFEVYLPRVEAVAEPATGADRLGEARGGSETILVVEDEGAVRDLVRRSLERKGYTVLCASSTDEALTLGSRRDRPIHLLLTDVVMPQMSGYELARRLTLLRPEMRVLYMSGYPENGTAQRAMMEPGAWLLEKPFTPYELTSAVRRVLDRPVGVNGAPA